MFAEERFALCLSLAVSMPVSEKRQSGLGTFYFIRPSPRQPMEELWRP